MKKILGIFLSCFIIILSLTSCTIDDVSDEDAYQYNMQGGEIYLADYLGNSREVVVPEVYHGYTVVGLQGTFKNNTKVYKVTLPKTISYIDAEAFKGSVVESVTFKETKGWYSQSTNTLIPEDRLKNTFVAGEYLKAANDIYYRKV